MPINMAVKNPAARIVELMLNYHGFAGSYSNRVPSDGIDEIQISRISQNMKGLPMHVKGVQHSGRVFEKKPNVFSFFDRYRVNIGKVLAVHVV